VIERAMILCDGDTFSVDESWFTRAAPRATVASDALTADLVERERKMIERALRESAGQVSGPRGAAARLGVPRQTLESKIRRLGVKRYQFKTA
jgi:formate hydrogenlyase transcriptional activator